MNRLCYVPQGAANTKWSDRELSDANQVSTVLFLHVHLDLRHLLLEAHQAQHEALEQILQIPERVLSCQI